MYIAESGTSVSAVLVREERGEQKPIFYVSKTLTDAETRYPQLEMLALSVVIAARKLRPYFKSHSIVVLSTFPLRSVLHSPSQSGRQAKWAVELSEYDIEYRGRSCAKSQVLADFLIQLLEGDVAKEDSSQEATLSGEWQLHVDGSSSKSSYGIGIRLTSPTGEILEQSFRLGFKASNNEAEYEAILAGIRLARAFNIEEISVFSDSQLVVNQFSGKYATKDERMEACLGLAKELAALFKKFMFTQIPRGENVNVDALANLASTSDPALKRMIPVEFIEFPSILPAVSLTIITRSQAARKIKVTQKRGENDGKDIVITDATKDNVEMSDATEDTPLTQTDPNPSRLPIANGSSYACY
ncbi:hypothetical protein AALP_AA7G126600 [Arabis alpina]|uniref:RNase H type-1 domain-containing protein n=1 Tax=Arabis alpina TaxID=50452 RepID=A0A087GHN3_ARAAL|nr:hypothetical protein AALP_AA7G126600 [Arabis alpina]